MPQVLFLLFWVFCFRCQVFLYTWDVLQVCIEIILPVPNSMLWISWSTFWPGLKLDIWCLDWANHKQPLVIQKNKTVHCDSIVQYRPAIIISLILTYFPYAYKCYDLSSMSGTLPYMPVCFLQKVVYKANIGICFISVYCILNWAIHSAWCLRLCY